MEARDEHTLRREVAALSATAAACALLALALCGKALGSRFLLYGTDTVAHDYIMLGYGWQQILEQRLLPLWCPSLAGGVPFIASFAFCPFYPTQWCFALSSFNTAFTLQYVFALTIGGVTSAFFARRLGSSIFAAVLAGVLFSVSGHFLTLIHAGHLQKVMAIAWAPFVLAHATKWAERGREATAASLLAGVGLALQLLASHTQIAYATFAAALLLSVASSRGALARLGRAFRSAALAAAVAVVLSAVQMFPGMEMSALSNRAAGVSYAEAVETSYPPLELWEYVIPRVFGASLGDPAEPYFGFWGERIVSDFIGWGAIMLALVGLGFRARPLRWPLASLVVLSILVGLGRYTPLYAVLYRWLPGMAKFRSPGTFMFIATVGLVQLAAFGFDRLLHGDGEGAEAKHGAPTTLRILAIGSVVLGLAMVVAPQVVGQLLHIGTDTQWSQFEALLSSKIRFSGWQFMLVGGLLALGLWATGYRTRHVPVKEGETAPSPLPKYLLAAVFAAIVVGIPLVANRVFIKFAPLDDYAAHLRRFAPLAAVPSRPGMPRFRFIGPNLLDNSALVWGGSTPAGYHPIVLQRYQQVVERLGWYHPAFLDQYAVATVIAPGEVKLGAETWTSRPLSNSLVFLRRKEPPAYVRPATRACLYSGPEEVLAQLARSNEGDASALCGDAVACDERPTSHGGALGTDVPLYLAGNPSLPAGKLVGPDLADAATSRCQVWEADCRVESVVGDGQTSSPSAGPMRGSLAQRVSISGYRPGAFLLNRSVRDCAALVALAENYAPGWKAWDAEGRRLFVFPANHSQLALAMPPGAAFAACRYEPFSWRVGCFVSLLGWAALLAWGAGRPRPAKRPPFSQS